MKILLRGGTVLALAAKAPNHHEADVLVDAGRIVEVGAGLSARDAEVIDATNTIVMPGFVDAHRLVRMALLRNLGTYDVAADSVRMTPDDLYAATLIGLLGAIEAGTTTVVDWADFPDDAASIEAARQAHSESGLRTVFVHRGEGGPPPTGSTTTAHASSDLTQANAATVAAEWVTARRSGLRIHARAGPAADDHRRSHGGDTPENLVLELRGVSRQFGAVRALTNVSFDCRAGEVPALVGENCSGKSTLLGIASGFVDTRPGRHPDRRESPPNGLARPGQRAGAGVPGPLADPGGARQEQPVPGGSARKAFPVLEPQTLGAQASVGSTATSTSSSRATSHSPESAVSTSSPTAAPASSAGSRPRPRSHPSDIRTASPAIGTISERCSASSTPQTPLELGTETTTRVSILPPVRVMLRTVANTFPR